MSEEVYYTIDDNEIEHIKRNAVIDIWLDNDLCSNDLIDEIVEQNRNFKQGDSK